MAEDILKIALGWAIPIFLAWAITKIPFVRQWLDRHPHFTGALIALGISGLTASTAVLVYHLYLRPIPPEFRTEPGTVLFTDEGGTCPPGYIDGSTMLIPRWHEASRKYVTPSDALNPVWYDAKKDWFWDHLKLCTKAP